MAESRNPSGGIRSSWYPQGAASESRSTEHRCGNCYGPLGKSAIPCKNEPKEVTRD